MKNIVLIANSITRGFIWENIKEIEFLKNTKTVDIYKIKGTDIQIGIVEVENNRTVFNSQIFKNLCKANNLTIDNVEMLANNGVFM